MEVFRWGRLLVRCGAAVMLGAVLLIAGAPAGRAQSGAAAIDRFVRSRLAATRLPGVAVAVTRGSRVVSLRGYGTGGRGEPITPDTQFRIASLSKSFTAFAVMRLVEAGRIGLDEPVRRYLPGFRLANAAGARITVRELLNQTSGLGDRGFPQLNDDSQTSLAGRVADLRNAHLVGTPGRTFRYCDLNYQVLGRMLEVVSGRPWAEVLRRKVFAPLGMDDTVAVPIAQDGPRAAPRLAEGSVLVYGFPVGRPELHGLLAGSGGVITTARDMTRWLTVQSGGGGPRLLGADAMRTMHTPPPGVNGDYAMGWVAHTGPRRLEHTGVLSTFYADQVVLPDSHIGVALLYPAYNALADTIGIERGVMALATGHDPPGGRFPDGRAIAVLLGVLTLGSIVLRSRALLRLRQWAVRAGARTRWRTALTVPGIVWPLVPAALVAALPWLTGVVTGRLFTRNQLFRAMPAIEIWLISAGVLGIALSTARIVALLRFHRSASVG